MAKSKKWWIPLVIIVGIILIVVGSCTGSYNKIVRLDQGVKSAWGQVENVYQRRYDLIPNLVETVKGYAAHESETLTAVTDARSRMGGVMNVSDDILDDPEAFRRFQQAQNELSGALQRLMVVTENYPDLKANQNFLSLQDQLEGTENRIAVERQRFNKAVEEYNGYIKSMPQVFIANMMGYREKPYFQAQGEASTAPQVRF